MRRLFCALWVGAVCLLSAALVQAQNLTLTGQAVQGGMMTGKTQPGTVLSLDGKPVAISAEGVFAIGFGRDAGPQSVLTATFPDGKSEKQVLQIKKRKFEIQRINGLPGKKVSPDKKAMERIIRESTALRAARTKISPVPFFLDGFAWPLKGRISGVYGSQRILNGKPRRPHSGVDIAAPEGTIVSASAGGIVALTHEDMFFTGKTIHIDHGLGVGTIYTHLSAILVKQGARVRKGDPIGRIGMTGRATGPHLHWGLTWGNVRLDPALAVGRMTGMKRN